MERRNEELLAQVEILQKQLSGAISALEASRKEAEELKSAHGVLEICLDQAETCSAKLRVELEEVKLENQKVIGDLGETKENSIKLEKEKENLLTKLKKSEEKLELVGKESDELKESKSALEARLHEAETVSASLRTELEGASMKFESEKEAFLSKLDGLEKKNKNLLSQTETLQKQLADATDGLETNKKETEELREAHDVLESHSEKLSREVEALQLELNESKCYSDDLEKEKESLVLQFQQKHVELESIKKQLSEATKQSEELKEIQNALEVQLSETQAFSETVKGELEKIRFDNQTLNGHLEVSNDYSKTLKLEKEELSTKLQQSNETCENFDRKNAELLSQIETLQKQLEVLEERLNETTTCSEKLQTELRASQLENRSVTAQFEVTKESLAKLKKEQTAAATKLQDSNQKHESLNKELSKTLNNLKSSNKELNEMKEENAKLSSKNENLEKEFSETTNNLDELKLAKDACEKELNETKAVLEEVELEHRKTKESLIELENERENLLSKLEESEGKNALCQRKNHELLSQNKILQSELCKTADDLEFTKKRSKELKEAKNVFEKQSNEASALSQMLKMEFEDLQSANEKTNAQLDETRENLKILTNEKENLSAKLKEADERNEELLALTENLQKQISEASNNLELSKNRSQELQEMQSDLEKQLVEMQASLDDLRVEKQKTYESLTRLEEERESLIKESERLAEVQNELQTLQKLLSAKENGLEELENDQKQLSREKEDLMKMVEEAKLEREEKKLEIATLQEKLERLIEEKVKLEKKVEVEEFVASETQEKMKALEETLQDYTITISGLKSVIDNNLESLETLKDDKSKLVDELFEIKNKEKETVVMIIELLKENKIDCGEANAEADVKSFISVHLGKVLDTKTGLERQMEELKAEVVATKKMNSSFKDMVEKLQILVMDQVELGSLESLKSSFDNIHDKINEALQLKQKLSEDLNRLENDKLDMFKELENVKIKNEEMKKVKVELEKGLEEEKEKVKNLSKELENLSMMKTKPEKENILGISTKSNKSREEELKKENMMLKKKVVLTENAKNNLEKVLKELRQEKKKNEDVTSPTHNDILYKKLLQEYIQVKEEHERIVKEKDAKYEEISKQFEELKNLKPVTIKSEDGKLVQDLQNIREAYANVMSVNSKLELEIVTLRKLIEGRNSELSDLCHVKEAYEKLLEENNKVMMEIDTVKYKRMRDKEEFIRLLKKEREETVNRETKKIQDIRTEYEGKLEKMKEKMLTLYREEVNKKVKSVKEGKNENTTLLKTIATLRSELLEADQKIQLLEMEREILKANKKLENELKVLPIQSISSVTVTTRNEERASTLPRPTITEEVTVSRRTSISGIPNLQMEDEEDLFNDKYLTDLKEGRCALPSNRESTTSRFSELAWRNSLVPPHLKSSYPAELQFISPTRFKDEDIKTGNVELDDSLCKLLPGEKPRKKDFGTTSYKRPGPPTPSKNGGRLSLQGNEVHPMREHCEAKTPKKSTPSRIRALFSGRNSSTREGSESQNNTTPSRVMASASSTSARSLFADSKMRLADRVQVNVNNISSLARQITRGSKSSEILMHSARNFAVQEHLMDNSESNLKKMQLLCVHLGYQHDSMLKSAQQIEEVKEQVFVARNCEKTMSLLSRRLQACLRLPRLAIQARLQQTKPKLSVSGDVVPIFGNARLFPDKIALRDATSSYTYANIFVSAKELAGTITGQLDGKTNQRVMFLCSNDADYVITLWAIWMSGQIAVPLSPLHPKNLLLYYANDTNANLLITTSQYVELMQRVAKNTNTKLHVLDDKSRLHASEKVAKTKSDLEAPLSLSFYGRGNALILYTSGTTGNPKGVVLTHKNLVFQVNTLLEAWKWAQSDIILHTLPLHHVHGIINALLCPLYIGAKTIMLPKFNANSVWTYLLGVNAKPDDRRITVYMAVPTIYSKLIDEYQKVFSVDSKMVEYIKNTLKNKMRLMVSGSAPLPKPVYEKWLAISGHRLLERYGMTEIGMCLSNLYDSEREPGYVGLPLPGVSVRLVQNDKNNKYITALECTNNNGEITCESNEKLIEDNCLNGELVVKSDGVFKEYYNRPEATKKEFIEEGWFKTGDLSSYSLDKNIFKILGRKSADIIKSGGYKISALEIETVLLGHEGIKDCIVVGLNDEKYGQKVAAIIVLKEGKEMTVETLKDWASQKLPKYSIPTVLEVVKEMQKNAMGKVNKKELVNTVFGGGK
ncbi:AMP-binding and/or SMC N domain containing protein [Asbolus verrucosus]|uniref:BLOC-1-related complex subunit 7 n=1 Tax=Asbolus verrucosus TaxID=1661398 RepID=A0A482WC88_ASBVE|nr:AMP-binding and/or SMC N domain containing protein [Asbolus verrucosus]